MLPTIAEILSKIEDGGEVPTLAPVMRRLLSLKTDESEASQLLELVRCDPAIMARLLRTANAPGQYTEAVLDLPAAFSRIGILNVRHVALATAFLDEGDSNVGPEEHFRMQWIWERCLCFAVAAETFATRFQIPNPARYYTFGLLSDLGILFLLHSFADDYHPLLDRWRIQGGDLAQIEEESMGVNHSVVGHHLAKAWSLGPEIEFAVRHHSEPTATGKDAVDLRVLALANFAAAVLFEDHHETGFERAIRFADESTGIKRQEFIDLLQRITLVADGAAVRISNEAGPAVPYVQLLRTINSELGRATLSYEQMVRELETAMRKAETLALKLEEANRRLRDAANIDPLTRVYNRRFFEEFLAWNFNRSQRYATPLGCLMIDIDHFKNVNDAHGHLTGDRILQGVAAKLKGVLRSTDIIARYGGEEFIVLLPDIHAEAVGHTAMKLNQAVRETSFPIADGELRVTISIGYVAYTPSAMPEVDAPNGLIQAADQFMYLAKENGRDGIWPRLSAESATAEPTSGSEPDSSANVQLTNLSIPKV